MSWRQSPWAMILAIYVLSVVIRIWSVSGGHFQFWFDVGRDAIISREILENGDLKIQGPTASGTNDSVYHGVLYYYLIGPLFTLFQGDPQWVLYAVIVLSSTAIFPVYALAKSLGGNSVGYTAALLYVISYDAYRGITWLSNPVIAVVAMPIFFYLLWEVFWKNRVRLFPWLMLSLAFLHQAAVLFFPWWGLIVVGWSRHWRDSQTRPLWQRRNVLVGLVIYFLGISTMIIAQLRAWWVGVFQLNKFSSFAIRDADSLQPIIGSLLLYVTKLTQGLYPMMPVLSVLVICLAVWVVGQQARPKQQFVMVMASSPLWLLAWHFRNMPHTFLGLEVLLVTLLAWVVIWLWQKRWPVMSVVLVLLFLLNQYQAWQFDRRLERSFYFIPQGAEYYRLLRAIDFTYQEAAGQPFTFSTVTNPIGYNTLWAYLYSWYGQKQYGYLPQYYGPDQTGIFGGDLISAAATPSANKHFIIEDPRNGIPEGFYYLLEVDQQQIVGNPIQDVKFGSLRVLEYQPAPKPSQK